MDEGAYEIPLMDSEAYKLALIYMGLLHLVFIATLNVTSTGVVTTAAKGLPGR